MSHVYVVGCPESDGRPEKGIRQAIEEALRLHQVSFSSVAGPSFAGIDRSSSFFPSHLMYEGLSAPLQEVLRVIRNGDRLIFVDAWNPSILTARYQLQCQERDVKMAGIFHSAANCPGDILGAASWATAVEEALGNVLDEGWVATNYLKEYLPWAKVTGLPISAAAIEPFRPLPQKPVVLWPHRMAEDKRFLFFVKVAQALHERYTFRVLSPIPGEGIPNVEFVHCKDRIQYAQQLRQGHFVFSSAKLETFGYAVIEAVTAGCRPVLIDDACYSELWDCQYLYPQVNIPVVDKALTRIGGIQEDFTVLSKVKARSAEFVPSLLSFVGRT